MNINVSNFRQGVPRFRLSNLAFEELSAPKTIDRTRDCSPTVSEEIRNIRSLIDHGNHVVILDGFDANTLAGFKTRVWALGSQLGLPMVQNHLGHKVIEVYDRGGKRIEEGARYHQTRQGAYVHNDGVSDPLPIDYLMLACGQKALLGGESILIDASSVYAQLMPFPDVLKELQSDFCFENRGMAEEEQLFRAPILSFSSEGIPLIRYFRVYIESAHLKAARPLTLAQVKALDFLDTVLDQSSVQHRILLEPGQILISADNKFLHTRTHFIDRHPPHVDIHDDEPLSGPIATCCVCGCASHNAPLVGLIKKPGLWTTPISRSRWS